MNNRIKSSIVLFAMSAVLIPLTACDKIAEKATEAALEKEIESETGQKIDIDTNGDGEITIKTDEGTITASEEGEQFTLKDANGNVTMASGDSVEIPKGFPKDVPLPDNFVANSTMQLEEDKYMVMGEVKGSKKSVHTEVSEKLTNAGWTDTQSLNSPDAIVITMKKDNRELSYTIQPEGDDRVSVMIGVGTNS